MRIDGLEKSESPKTRGEHCKEVKKQQQQGGSIRGLNAGWGKVMG